MFDRWRRRRSTELAGGDAVRRVPPPITGGGIGDDVAIDPASVGTMLGADRGLRWIDGAIAREAGLDFEPEWLEHDPGSFDEEASSLSGHLRAAGFSTVGELRRWLEAEREVVLQVASERLRRPPVGFVVPGVSLYYAALIRVLDEGDDEALQAFWDAEGRSPGPDDRAAAESDLRTLLAAARQQQGPNPSGT